MKRRIFKPLGLAMSLTLLLACFVATPKEAAAQAASMRREAQSALETLYETTPAAKALGKDAVGILVFPSIVKGGFIFGGQYGKGTLFKGGNKTEYYKSTAVSYGLQAGAQKFGYALFFMTKDDLDYLERSSGWEVGVGPSIVILDAGMAASTTTTTAKKGVYAFFFNQKGLMAGLGLQGTKITRIYPVE